MKNQVKNSMKKRILTAFILTISAPTVAFGQAGATLSAPKLEIGDRFETTEVAKVEYYFRDFDDENGPSVPSYCYNMRRTEARIDYDLLKFRISDPLWNTPAESPYFDTEIRFFDRRKCVWNHQELEKRANKNLKELLSLKRSYVLDKLDPSGTAIAGRYVLQGDALRSLFVSGRNSFEVPLKLNLSNCIDEEGYKRTSWETEHSGKLDLTSIISELRSRGYRKLLKCDFRIERLAWGGDIVKKGEFSSGEADYLSILGDDDQRIFTSDDADPFSSDDFSMEYSRAGSPRDQNLEQVAIGAARDFVDFISNDYGDLLYRLSESRSNEAERREAIRAFFEAERVRIQDWFALIDQNYAHVSLMNKVSMVLSMNDMYQTIAKIEQSVAKTSSVNLDRVVRTLTKRR